MEFTEALYKTNNECFLFVQWKEYFHSVKDENALINIHYLYNIRQQSQMMFYVQSKPLHSFNIQ